MVIPRYVKGVYLVFLEITENTEIEVGALGEIEFEKGTYVYVGSAMNSVEKRLERHFSDVDNLHWHIDYVTAEAKPFDYFILPESSDYEQWLAENLQKYCRPVPEFGSSDSTKNSHFFRIER